MLRQSRGAGAGSVRDFPKQLCSVWIGIGRPGIEIVAWALCAVCAGYWADTHMQVKNFVPTSPSIDFHPSHQCAPRTTAPPQAQWSSPTPTRCGLATGQALDHWLEFSPNVSAQHPLGTMHSFHKNLSEICLFGWSPRPGSGGAKILQANQCKSPGSSPAEAQCVIDGWSSPPNFPCRRPRVSCSSPP